MAERKARTIAEITSRGEQDSREEGWDDIRDNPG